MIDLVNTLPGLLKNLPSTDAFRKAVIFAVWKSAAGGELSKRAKPVDFSDGRLTVAVPSNAWRRNLESLSGQIIHKLNAAIGEPSVRFIEFKFDESAAAHSDVSDESIEASQIKFERATLKMVPRDVKKAACSIEDKALKRAFLVAAGSCMARNDAAARKALT